MVTRRDFLKTMSMASAGLALGTGDLLHAQTASPKKGRGDKVKIAYIGIGNRGEQIIEDFARTGMVEVVALCDVDMGAKHTQKIMAKYPKAKQFRDFRQMFDKAGNEFDAVAIATPDHSHFPISMLALASGKHVYVEKPLARTFYEAELLMQAALKRPNLVTQVGNQGHSEANYFQFKAWMDAGIIKDVTAITAHMNNPCHTASGHKKASRQHLIAFMLPHSHRFTGNHGFIHFNALGFQNHTVRTNLITAFQHHHIIHNKLIQRYLLLRAIPDNRRLRGCNHRQLIHKTLDL